MEDEFFDKDLLVSLIDGLGYWSEDAMTYHKNEDTLGAVLVPTSCIDIVRCLDTQNRF
jgi:hypothetical protein